MIILSPKHLKNCFPDLRFATFLITSTEFGLHESNDSSLNLVLVAGESNASCLKFRAPVVSEGGR